MNWVELIGYVASALVVVSLAMRSVVRLRVVSFVGSVVFIAYGALIGAVPIVVTNAAVALINVWRLRQELGPRHPFGLVPIAPDEPYLRDFLGAYGADIERAQPGFALAPDADVWLLTRDGLPAGVLAGRLDPPLLTLALDYVTPAYRDTGLGRWLYNDAATPLRGLGVTRVLAHAPTADHARYLRGVGFAESAAGLTRELP